MDTHENDAQPNPFRDPELPIEARISDLLALLTLDEKIALLSTNLGVPRLAIPGVENVEGIHGLVATGFLGGGKIDIPTTTFPQPYGMAQCWDPDLIQQAGAVIGAEARYVAHSCAYGHHKLLVMAPNADLARDPRWGRTDECYGEDAFFNGTLAVALVRGLQGDHPTYWQVAALLKHFLANSHEDGRLSTSSDFDERLLREYYSVPFRMGVVQGGARAYMAAYNAHNGVPCTVHPMLKDMTIAEWGLDGVICTDFRGMSNLVFKHQTHPDLEHAAAASLQAGISQFLDDYAAPVRAALDHQLLTEADLDAAIARNLRTLLRLGLLDPQERVPYTAVDEAAAPWLSERHRSVARRVTQAGIVLLKNAGQLLPLDKSALRSVAVIGPLAGRVMTDLYNPRPPYTVSPLEGITGALAAHGCMVLHQAIEPTTSAPADPALPADTGAQPPIYVPARDIPAAVELARAADLAIVCVGNQPLCGGWAMGHATPSWPSEGMEALDRQSIDLEQEELIQAVYAANRNTVVVLIASFPYAINWTQAHVPAIVHMGHGSQELGNALADVLFGAVNPAGRLVQTWPQSLEQLPPMLDYDLRHGRTYMYFQGTPLYPFGYGLSYSSFGYSNLQLSSPTLGAEAAISVGVDVTNTGDRAGDEVVQLYVQHLNSAIENDTIQLRVGRSSADIQLEASLAVESN